MIYRLCDLFQIFGGGTPKTQNTQYWNGDIPWISVADMGNSFRYVDRTAKTITEKGLKESSTKLLKPGDIIISARGTVGVINQVRTPMAFNQTCYGLRAKQDIVDQNYLYYLLLQKVPELQQIGHGAVFNTITRDSFELVTVDLPTLETQKEIAHILGTLDDKIELNRKMNKTLEEIAQALYKHWFIDFEFPNEEGKPYKSSGGEMVDSELGLIPKGWRVGTIRDLCSLEYGKPLVSDSRHHGKFPVMGSNGQVGCHNEAIVKGPGIVVGRKGNPGTVTWVQSDFFPIDTTFFVKQTSDNVPITYVYYCLLVAGLERLSVDSAVPGLNRTIANASKTIIPETKHMNPFDDIVQKNNVRIRINSDEIENIISSRTAIIGRLINIDTTELL